MDSKKPRAIPSRQNSHREGNTEKTKKVRKLEPPSAKDFILNKLKKVKDGSTKPKKKKSKKSAQDDLEDEGTTGGTQGTTAGTGTSSVGGHTTAALATINKNGKIQTAFMKNPTAEQKAQYERFVRGVLFVGVDGLLREYNEQLKPYLAKEWKREIFDRNFAKNRYKDVVCNDVTRVVLSDGKDGDYIHANHVRLDNCANDFICTQGPMNSTKFDFWRMIVNCRVVHIIMLCEVVEQGKTKCEQYWPLKAGEKMIFGDITVTNSRVNVVDRHVVKTNLEVTRGSEKYQVRHHHWKTWPDKLVPNTSLAALRILQSVRNTQTPIVVHCSAGIGRTGTVVAIELCLQKLLSTGNLSLIAMCKKLRDCRMHSVQVELQYIYLAQTIVEYGKAMGFWSAREVSDDFEKFKEQLDRLTKAKEAEEMARTAARQINKNVVEPAKTPIVTVQVECEKEKQLKLKEKEREAARQKEKAAIPVPKRPVEEKVEELSKPKKPATPVPAAPVTPVQPARPTALAIPAAPNNLIKTSPPKVHVIQTPPPEIHPPAIVAPPPKMAPVTPPVIQAPPPMVQAPPPPPDFASNQPEPNAMTAYFQITPSAAPAVPTPRLSRENVVAPPPLIPKVAEAAAQSPPTVHHVMSPAVTSPWPAPSPMTPDTTPFSVTGTPEPPAGEASVDPAPVPDPGHPAPPVAPAPALRETVNLPPPTKKTSKEFISSFFMGV